MNNKKLSTIALFISFLIIMLPVIEAQQLNGNQPSDTTTAQVTITSSIPRYSRETVINIRGTTTPNSTIELFIKTVKKRETTANTDGAFSINAVHLPEIDNEVVLKATDTNGNFGEQKYTVTIDTVVPVFKIINFTTVATQPLLEIKAETSKPINVTYSATQISDKIPPDKILNIKKDRIEKTGISIAWEQSTAIDFGEYAIYRNEKRIATTTSPYYSDTQINSETEYDYRVSAVDKNCNEGQQSDTLITKSLKNENRAVQEHEDARFSCETEQKTTQIENSGKFTIPIQLQEGLNEVKITATDLAGHTVQYTNKTLLDTLPPQIIDTNLEQLSPTYIPDIKIKGILNKKATVFAYINDIKEPIKYVVANDDGTFELPIQLRRDVKTTGTATQASLETGEGWENTVKIEAIDSAKRKTPALTKKIMYSFCGFGSWFDVRIGEPLPKKLTPRFLLQGIQETGLIFNATYTGRYNVTIGQITASLLMLSPELENEYDNGIVDLNLITQAQTPKSILGYVQAMFRPWNFPPDTKMTAYEKEQNISRHRASDTGPKGSSGIEKYGKKGKTGAPYVSSQYKNCLVPGVGCAKIFLEIDIPFQEKIPKQIVDPLTQKTIGQVELVNRVQKKCMPIEMAMDVPVPSKLIPKNFLKAAIELLDRAVDAMDTVLNPLTTVGTYVLYSCLASTARLYLDEIRETWNCDVQNYLDIIKSATSDSEEPAFDKSIAQAGLCEAVYTSKEKAEKCNVCKKSIESTKKFQYEILQPICDRIACPSAPTLQTQIRNADELEEVQIDKANDKFKKWNVDGKVYSGDDCAFGPYQKEEARKLELTYEAINNNNLGIKDIYLLTENKGTPRKLNDAGTINPKEDCKEYARPAHPYCCGKSYQQEWASACGPLPIIDTFDELQESACLAAQKSGKKTADKELNCGRILNAAAGFCEPGTGDEIIDPIPTGIKYKNKPAAARTDEVYVLVIPTGMFSRKGGSTQKTDYQVYRGYVAERFTTGTAAITKKGQIDKSLGKIEFEVNPKTSVISDGTKLTQFFEQEKKEGTPPKKDINGFMTELCKEKGEDIDENSCSQTKAQEVYNRIYERIGASDKEYIVNPMDEGLLRSFQCVCLPALTSYLQFWRNILSVVRDCFKTILLTGDGSEGVCKATLSTYVCDLLFNVIKCFAQKFNSPGTGSRARGGIGDFIGTLTKSGTEVQRKVQGRYGETALWKTMFVDKKLIHSICAFAFTGTWNFDASEIFSQTVASIPIESQGFLTPCTRQFISFNPATDPKGKTSWTYHFGVGLAAGADVRYDLLLKCSQGFRCNPADGYKNGECDCNKKGELTRTIFAPELGTGQLQKNDILNKEIFYTIQADTSDAAVRYDKAVLRYSYIDPKSNKEQTKETTCDIRVTGGDAPNFCQFDPFSLSYRCQFGIGESAVRLEKIEAIYSRAFGIDAIPVYGIADDIKLALSIRQQQPIERARSLEGTKFVLYKIKNQKGDVVAQLNEQDAFFKDFKLDGTGSYVKEIPISGAITDLNFGSQTSSTGATFTQQMLEKGKIVSAPTTIISDFESDENASFVIRFYTDRETKKFSIYEGTNIISDGKYLTGITIRNDISVMLNFERIVSYTYTKQTGLTSTQKRILFKIKELPSTDGDVLILKTQTTENPCTTKKPVQWSAEISIHDADRNGRPTSQTSIDPATGQEAKQEIKINAICIPGQQIPAKTPTQAETAAKAKEEGRCDSRGYIKNTEECYCGTNPGYNPPNCGNAEKGLYCLNNKQCSKKPECQIANSPDQPIQEDCTCTPGTNTVNHSCEKKTDKAVYCCNTNQGINCVDDFSKCVPATATTPTTPPPNNINQFKVGDKISMESVPYNLVMTKLDNGNWTVAQFNKSTNAKEGIDSVVDTNKLVNTYLTNKTFHIGNDTSKEYKIDAQGQIFVASAVV